MSSATGRMAPPAQHRAVQVRARRAGRWIADRIVLLYAGLAITYLLIPVGVIIAFSFNHPVGSFNFVWGGFSLSGWENAFAVQALTSALFVSLKLAALAALIATALGTGIALALVRHQFIGRRVANLLIIVPMTTPEVVIAAALLSFFVSVAIPLGFVTLLLAHVMFCISFIVIVVRSRLISFDRSLELAAADLGARPMTTFRLVTLPLIAPAVAGGAFLAFVLSLDDFVVSNFNSGTTLTFPLYVYGASLRAIPVQVNVIATMLFTATVLVGVLAWWSARRRSRRDSVVLLPSEREVDAGLDADARVPATAGS